MNSKILIGGLLLAFTIPLMPASAYHIVDCDRVDPDCPDSANPTAWGAQFGAAVPPEGDSSPVCEALDGVLNGEPVNTLPTPVPETASDVYDIVCFDGVVGGIGGGDTLVGFILCEVNDDPATVEFDGFSGAGGLCFMSPGFTDLTADSVADCDFVGVGDHNGNANGNAPDYTTTADEVCITMPAALPVITAVGRRWFEVTMQDVHHAGANISFGFQIADVSCTDASGALVNAESYIYDDQFAYTVADGDVAGFPTGNPADSNEDGVPDFGGYTMNSVEASSGTPCDGPRPIYYA